MVRLAGYYSNCRFSKYSALSIQERWISQDQNFDIQKPPENPKKLLLLPQTYKSINCKKYIIYYIHKVAQVWKFFCLLE